jgi:hypothetical protein
MDSHLAIVFAVLFDLKALRSVFLVLAALVIQVFANCAFQVNQVVL